MGQKGVKLLTWAAVFLTSWAMPVLILFFGQDWQVVWSQMLSDDVLRAVRLALSQASLSMIFSVMLGVPWGLLNSGHFFGTPFSERILSLCFAIPLMTVCVFWLGYVDPSFRLVVIAHVGINAPMVAYWVSLKANRMPTRALDQARSLGARPLHRVTSVWIPHLFGVIAKSAIQVFLLCLTSFVIVSWLGGGPDVESLETFLFHRLRGTDFELSESVRQASAVACGIWILGFAIAGLWISFKVSGMLGGLHLTDNAEHESRDSGRQPKVFRAGASFFMAGLAFCSTLIYPLGLKWGSAWSESWNDLRSSALPSFALGFGSSLLCIVLAVLGISIKRDLRLRASKIAVMFESIELLPLVTTPLMLGFAWDLAYSRHVDLFGPSLWPLIVIQAILSYPFASQMLAPLVTVDWKNAKETARSLGAKPIHLFQEVYFPYIRAFVMTAFSVIAVWGMAEVTLSNYFYHEERVPIGLFAGRLSSQYQFDRAQSLALYLWIFSAAAMWLWASGRNTFGGGGHRAR